MTEVERDAELEREFTGRTLFLTGATGGIGQATARLFRDRGANLVLCDSDAGALDGFAKELDPGGARVAISAMDAADEDHVERALALAEARFGGIDFLVPCAGVYPTSAFEEITTEAWRRTMAVNLDGVFILCRCAARLLGEGAAITLISSIAGHRGSFQHADYAASKGAILALARSLAQDLGPKVRANAISPGIIATPMTADLVQAREAEFIRTTPLRRVGRPEEVASVIGFLSGAGASFITGETIQVNGGLYMS